MQIPIYQVDAFTDALFGGNPAAVCPLEAWLPDETLQRIAAENNLSETAFFVPAGDRFEIRWLTPTTEVPLCGHATLAASFVLFNILHPDRDRLHFDSKSGPLHPRALLGQSPGQAALRGPSSLSCEGEGAAWSCACSWIEFWSRAAPRWDVGPPRWISTGVSGGKGGVRCSVRRKNVAC